MLYLIYGSDAEKARLKFDALIETLVSRKPEAGIFRLNSLDFNNARFDELIGSRGLFAEKYIVSCNKLWADKLIRSYIEERMEKIAQSENIFIFLEESLSKDSFSLFQKNAAKIQEYKIQQNKTVFGPYNIFAVTDALARRDRKRLWVQLEKAVYHQIPYEEIFWKFVWQIKMLLLVRHTKSAKEANINPFTYKKARENSERFSEKELITMSGDLVKLYADVLSGRRGLSISLERFVLSI